MWNCLAASTLDSLLASYFLLKNSQEGKEDILDGMHFRDFSTCCADEQE